jgi:multicomponent Na+:H+ antiporter subunit G
MTTSPVDIIATGLLLAGCLFYLAGTIGLLRFPDVYCRLHALTKADNLGLLMVCSGLAISSGSWRISALLGFIWLLGLLAATVSAHLIARHAHALGSPAAIDGEDQ